MEDSSSPPSVADLARGRSRSDTWDAIPTPPTAAQIAIWSVCLAPQRILPQFPYMSQ